MRVSRMQVKTYFSILIVSVLFLVSVAHAKEVTLYRKGITLNANLEIAAGKTIKDDVILITHGGPEYKGATFTLTFRAYSRTRATVR